jgi:hypothetical protein
MSPLEYHFVGFTRLLCLARCPVAESCTVDFKVLRFVQCLKLQDFPQREVTSGNLPALSPKREEKLGVANSLIELTLLLRFHKSFVLFFFYLLAGWDFGYCGHYWPIVPAPDDR